MNLPTTQNRKNSFTKDNKNLKRLSSFLATFILVLTFLSSSLTSYADCTANDVRVVGAFIADANQVKISCITGILRQLIFT
jgi:hypothetical protein